MRTLAAFILVGSALAGCFGAEPLNAADAGALAPRLAFEGALPQPSPAVWEGGPLEAEESRPLGGFYACAIVDCFGWPACTDSSCERFAFELELPEGFWDAHDGALQVRAQSVRNYTVTPFVRVLDGAGAELAKATVTDWLSIATIEEAPAGAYEIEIAAGFGAGRYEAAIVLDARPTDGSGAPAPPRERLPNLVTIRPSDLRIEAQGDRPESALLAAGGVAGCNFDETVEAQARRCLRFSNGIANVGEGPLEVRLESAQAAGALAGQGRFVQRILSTDGSVREVEAGGATFHAAHGHYHYAGLATYELFAFDWASMTRGEKVGEGRKAGFCFYDTAMVDLAREGVGPQAYDGSGCLDPTASARGEAWYTGVSPGFTDFYGWYLSDQFVEITGLPDGTYELVTVADGVGTLVESDTTDNAATAVFRLDGNDVRVLATTGA